MERKQGEIRVRSPQEMKVIGPTLRERVAVFQRLIAAIDSGADVEKRVEAQVGYDGMDHGSPICGTTRFYPEKVLIRETLETHGTREPIRGEEKLILSLYFAFENREVLPYPEIRDVEIHDIRILFDGEEIGVVPMRPPMRVENDEGTITLDWSISLAVPCYIEANLKADYADR